MLVISSIKPQRKKSRFNVFLDGKFAFGVDEEILIKHKLRVGKKISQEEIREIINEKELQKAFDKALHFLSYRPRSEKEIKDFLLGKNLGEETIKLVIKKLEEENLLDDQEFVRWWVEQRQTFRPKGIRLIKQELFKKGISKEIIDGIEEEKDKEYRLALKAAEKKLSLYKNLPEKEARLKLTSFLQRRGFSWEIIRLVIDEFLKFK